MSRSDHGNSTPSSSLPASNAHSMNQDFLPQPTRHSTADLNILFLGETSIIDFIAAPKERKNGRRAGRRNDARVVLDGKTFTLHALPANESASPVTLGKGIQKILTNIRKNGNVHLLVYCMDALHSTNWIHDTHRTIVSYSTPSSRIPAVAVVVGMSDGIEQQRWWSSNKDAFTEQGLRFDDYGFIRMTNRGAQSPTGDHIAESRRVLHTLIKQNCAYALGTEVNSGPQRATPYKQQIMGNSFHSLLTSLAPKPTHVSPNPPVIDVVLLGEVGVGKSSLINLIARENVAEVSSDITTCTRAPVKHTFEEKGRTFHLYDTPGLVDPQMGVDPFIDPIDRIEKLIRRLGDGKGPDLLLFCIENPKPTAALQRNYRLFSEVICGGRVPFALTITKLDQGQDADGWQSRYSATIRRYGIDCSGCFSVGRGKSHAGPNADLAGQLRESFLEFIVECTDRQRTKISSLRASMERMVVSAASSLRGQAWTPEKVLIKQCGLEKQTARELANRITFPGESHN